MKLELRPPWLLYRFDAPHDTLSWAIVGGGYRSDRRSVAWLNVTGADLAPPIDPEQLLASRLESIGESSAVGMLTSRRIEAFTEAQAEHDGVEAYCTATVGLSNALRCGDPPGDLMASGTINLLVRLSAPLTSEAMVEALSIAVEARTAAVFEAGFPSRLSDRTASGTGTDCVVIAAPVEGERLAYAGMHTTAGCVVGAAVEEAIGRGVSDWLDERRQRGQ